MKKIIILSLIILVLIFISGCKQKDIQVGGLRAELEIYPVEKIINTASGIDVSVNLESKEASDIIGKVCISDTPDENQFGGIEGLACEDFSISAVKKGDVKRKSIKPVGASGITYKEELTSTVFIANIRYKKEIEARSNPFCIRSREEIDKEDQANKCNIVQKNIGFPKYSVAKSLDKYLYDQEGHDNIIDLASLKIVFEEDKDCKIINPDLVDDFNLNSEVYKDKEIYYEIELEEAGIKLDSSGEECEITKDSTENRKVIICEVNLNIKEDYYDNEVLITKFRYGCELPSLTRHIQFIKE